MRRIKHLIQKKHNHKFHIPAQEDMLMYVKKGGKVRVGSKLFKSRTKRIVDSYHLPSELGIKAGTEMDHIVRLPGEFIGKGEVLAERMASGGLVVKKAISAKEGVLSTARLESGYLDILSEKQDLEVVSDMFGEVIEADARLGINIETTVWAMDFFAKQFGKRDQAHGFGKFKVVNGGGSVYTVKDLEESYYGEIVFAGRFVYPDLVLELYERGAEMVIVYAMNYMDYKSLEVPVIVLGGFGQLAFPKKLQEFISAMDEKLTSLDFKEKEIVFGDAGEYLSDGSKHADFEFTNTYGVGTEVMLTDAVHFGRVGKVISIEDGNSYLNIELDGGGKVFVSTDVVIPIRM